MSDKVVCNSMGTCPEIGCGGRKPHRRDHSECGHCPKNKAAQCVPINVERWDELTLEEQEHLTSVAGVVTTADLVKNFAGQKTLRGVGKTEPCWTCKSIAVKLGYGV